MNNQQLTHTKFETNIAIFFFDNESILFLKEHSLVNFNQTNELGEKLSPPFYHSNFQ